MFKHSWFSTSKQYKRLRNLYNSTVCTCIYFNGWCPHRCCGNGFYGGYGYKQTHFKLFKQHWSNNGPDGGPYSQVLRRSQAKRPEKVEKIGRWGPAIYVFLVTSGDVFKLYMWRNSGHKWTHIQSRCLLQGGGGGGGRGWGRHLKCVLFQLIVKVGIWRAFFVFSGKFCRCIYPLREKLPLPLGVPKLVRDLFPG